MSDKAQERIWYDLNAMLFRSEVAKLTTPFRVPSEVKWGSRSLSAGFPDLKCRRFPVLGDLSSKAGVHRTVLSPRV